ncbi:UDP-N-acetylglucosamine 2-epimerase [Paenibacillus sepulcri]|uniref:UDP-N-acetylglucosamine 2-epimerase (Hydrolyzing) n=1 Tax=Paenibacillus sepulcri TaxID=359917 RepID=A0ABS7BV22_9BACL|nr:UDP-N-acetylglucosamine 2-epimerase (hydrolyzing) [Paenibacillus sepulcri]
MTTEAVLSSSDGLIKVLALTGIRSEYDLLYPLLKELQEDSEFDLGVIVSGVHLTELHDYSVKLIERDNFRIADKIENMIYSNTASGKVKSVGILIQGLAHVLEREKPDLLLILGDREEVVAGAMAGTYMGVPVIHIAGGDNTFPEGGDVDEEIRHAATKLSHVHLTMHEEHSRRIEKLGEEPWRIHTVGNGGVDRLRMGTELTLQEMAKQFHAAVLEKYIVFIYHPLSSELDSCANDVRICFEACLATGLQVFVGAPNSDPGYQDIARVFQEYAEHPNVHMYKNLPRDEFVTLLRHAACLVGNSSLGIHEAPYLGLPVINVGQRQRGRVAGKNVQFVSAEYNAINSGLERVLHDHVYRSNIKVGDPIYGDGHMAEKAKIIIKNLPSRAQLLAKKITY